MWSSCRPPTLTSRRFGEEGIDRRGRRQARARSAHGDRQRAGRESAPHRRRQYGSPGRDSHPASRRRRRRLQWCRPRRRKCRMLSRPSVGSTTAPRSASVIIAVARRVEKPSTRPLGRVAIGTDAGQHLGLGLVGHHDRNAPPHVVGQRLGGRRIHDQTQLEGAAGLRHPNAPPVAESPAGSGRPNTRPRKLGQRGPPPRPVSAGGWRSERSRCRSAPRRCRPGCARYRCYRRPCVHRRCRCPRGQRVEGQFAEHVVRRPRRPCRSGHRPARRSEGLVGPLAAEHHREGLAITVSPGRGNGWRRRSRSGRR